MLAVYAILTQQDIGKLFMAGIIPGLLAMAMYVLTIFIIVDGEADFVTGGTMIAGAKLIEQAGGAVAGIAGGIGLEVVLLCVNDHGASNDTVGGASETPRITPVSCTGKKPLGTITYNAIVPTSVAAATQSVAV